MPKLGMYDIHSPTWGWGMMTLLDSSQAQQVGPPIGNLNPKALSFAPLVQEAEAINFKLALLASNLYKYNSVG